MLRFFHGIGSVKQIRLCIYPAASSVCCGRLYGKCDRGDTEKPHKKNKWKIKNIEAVLLDAALFFLICAPMCKGIYMFASDDRHYAAENGISGYAVFPKDYPIADSSSKEWEGMKIFFPVKEGEQIWYHDFPAILYEGNLDGIERRGSSIRDGFRSK